MVNDPRIAKWKPSDGQFSSPQKLASAMGERSMHRAMQPPRFEKEVPSIASHLETGFRCNLIVYLFQWNRKAIRPHRPARVTCQQAVQSNKTRTISIVCPVLLHKDQLNQVHRRLHRNK